MTRARIRGDDELAVIAQAVADPTRLALLREIQAAAAPVTVRELAERFGLHGNAVRQHVAHLRDAGLIIEEVERTGGAGRPRSTYGPNPDRVGELGGWNPYETLAQLLVEVPTGVPAREVGAAYGRRLAAAAPQGPAAEVLAAVARRHGFQPTVTASNDAVDLVLGRCPFASSVTPDRLVCELHRGIAEGIAETRGDATVVALDLAPPRAGGCRFHLRLIANRGALT